MAELENNNTNTGAEVEETNEPKEKLYTEAELQQYGDRRVTEALKKQERKQQDKAREAKSLPK